MGRIKTAFVLVLCFTALAAFSQQDGPHAVKSARFTLTAGTGWTHYIDNLDNGNQNISKDFAGFSFRFFWEPEYRLSLGAETGFYTLFKVKSQSVAGESGNISRRIIPMLLLVRMRIIDNFYLGTGFGFARLTNTATGTGQKIVTNTMSLSNYQFSVSWIYPLSSRWQLGGEAKLYNFGAYNDWMYSVQALCAWRF
jgi:hypothetical protein